MNLKKYAILSLFFAVFSAQAAWFSDYVKPSLGSGAITLAALVGLGYTGWSFYKQQCNINDLKKKEEEEKKKKSEEARKAFLDKVDEALSAGNFIFNMSSFGSKYNQKAELKSILQEQKLQEQKKQENDAETKLVQQQIQQVQQQQQVPFCGPISNIPSITSILEESNVNVVNEQKIKEEEKKSQEEKHKKNEVEIEEISQPQQQAAAPDKVEDTWEFVGEEESTVIEPREIQSFIDENFKKIKNLTFLANNYQVLLDIADFYLSKQISDDKDMNAIYKGKLNTFKDQLNKAYYNAPWTNGRDLMITIIKNNDITFSLNNRHSFGSIDAANIVWYFYVLAVNKGEAFIDGTFVIEYEDYGSPLIKYLQGIAGERISSHYKGEKTIHYGIDVPKKIYLPNDKHHILFAELPSFSQDGKHYFFLKPEKYGVTTWGDWFNHAIEYLESQGKKLFKKGADDAPGMHKERVPHDILKAWDNLLNVYKIEDASIFNKAKEHGIRYMYSVINTMPIFSIEFADTKSKKEARDKVLDLLSQYDKKDIQLRTGREVILSNDYIKSGLNDIYNKLDKIFLNLGFNV